MRKTMTNYKLIKLSVVFLIASLFNPIFIALAKEAAYPAQMIVNFYRTPTVAVALDKTYLIYEIYVTSQMNMQTELTSLEVKNGNKVIFTDKTNKISFKPGEMHIIYMSIPFPKLSDVPHQI